MTRSAKDTKIWTVAYVVVATVSAILFFVMQPDEEEDTKGTAPSKTVSAMQGETEATLAKLNLVLPAPSTPKGNYVQCVPVNDNLLHLCGHIPTNSETGELITGKVGKDLSVEEGYEAAKACALAIISTLQNFLGKGQLDRVKRIVKVVGFVNCTDDFTQQPSVINGASDLFGAVFGERGKHARSAVGTNALPLNVATEVECIVELHSHITSV